MSETQSGLDRYEGRYLINWGWEDGKDVSRFANVKVAGDHLTLESETVSFPIDGPGFLPIGHPLIERRVGDPRPLGAASEAHTFDAADSGRSYRFVLGDGDVAQSVIVIRDGRPSQPCPKFVPLPEEVPRRRERHEWLDLGHAGLCMMAGDAEALKSFYERLGFVARAAGDSVTIAQGWTAIGFLGFQRQPCINYRGASIVENAFELAKRGYVVANGLVEATHVQGDGTGGFFVYDPNGHRMFFNTHPVERADYEAWKSGTLQPRADNSPERAATSNAHHTSNAMVAPVSLPLGELVACLDVTDLSESMSFYRGMGFEIIDQTSEFAILFSRPAREDRYAFPVRLRQSAEPRFSFGFLCEDVNGVCNEIKARDIEIITTSDGPAFVDPDGNCVTLLPPLTDSR